jgi:putative oxidoreductase
MWMFSEPQRDLLRDKGTKFGRFLIGLLFVGSALTMLFISGPTVTANYFANLGLPYPALLVWPVIVLKIVAGTMVIFGKRVGLASMILIAFTILATVVAHRSFQDVNLFKNLAIVGALLYLVAFGPGGTNIKLVRVQKEK